MPVTLTNALLVDYDPPRVRTGAIRIVGDQIAAVGERVCPLAEDEAIDCGGSVVMPGLVNGHTHLYSALAAGMPQPNDPPVNFHQILERIWWRLDRAHSEASVRASGEVGALAAVRCGTTTLIDHHASPSFIGNSLSVLRDGIDSVGCRGVLCYEVTDRNGPTGATEGIRENERFLDACRSASDGRFAGMVGAHACFTLEDESLAECISLCRDRSAGLHIHVAEDGVDERICIDRWGRGVIDRIAGLGGLEIPNSLFAHGTHLSPSDIQRLAGAQQFITLAHNPSSNMNNGVGYTPIVEHKKTPVLGTDGIGADMWREARTALFKSHDAHKVIAPSRVLEMLAQSARVASAHLGCRLGALAEKAAADIVITRYVPATPLDADSLIAHLIYGMGPEYIKDVMVCGEWKLRDGNFVGCDEGALRLAARDAARDLFARMRAL